MTDETEEDSLYAEKFFFYKAKEVADPDFKSNPFD
jgi:hypothetical protein